MSKAKQMGHWLWQVWPIWLILFLAGTNVLLYHLVHYNSLTVHRVAGPILQVIGGAFVLYFLNKNMGVFNRGSLVQRVVRWVKACPLWSKPITLHAEGLAQIQGGGSVTAHGYRKGETFEERVEILERRLEEYYREMQDGDLRLRRELESARDRFRQETAEMGTIIAEVKSMLTSTAVGSMNHQVFGVLLVLYGTLLPII